MDDAVSELDQGDPADVDAGVGKPLSAVRLLARLNEIWLFFFTGVLPHLEGVFWVLRSDDRLRDSIKAIRRTSMRVSANP
jgi:hypothetical protein